MTNLIIPKEEGNVLSIWVENNLWNMIEATYYPVITLKDYSTSSQEFKHD